MNIIEYRHPIKIYLNPLNLICHDKELKYKGNNACMHAFEGQKQNLELDSFSWCRSFRMGLCGCIFLQSVTPLVALLVWVTFWYLLTRERSPLQQLILRPLHSVVSVLRKFLILPIFVEDYKSRTRYLLIHEEIYKESSWHQNLDYRMVHIESA